MFQVVYVYIYLCCCVYFLRWANSQISILSELIISYCEGEGLGAGVFHGFPRHEHIVRPGAKFIFCVRFKIFAPVVVCPGFHRVLREYAHHCVCSSWESRVKAPKISFRVAPFAVAYTPCTLSAVYLS